LRAVAGSGKTAPGKRRGFKPSRGFFRIFVSSTTPNGKAAEKIAGFTDG
jgi:hypothetical protein